MPRGVNEVDEEARAILALLDEIQVVLRKLIEEGDGPEKIVAGGRDGSHTSGAAALDHLPHDPWTWPGLLPKGPSEQMPLIIPKQGCDPLESQVHSPRETLQTFSSP